MPNVSFIIPSYNSCKTIARTLESIFGQSLSESILEVIVVDSSDDAQTRPLFSLYHSSNLSVIKLCRKTSPAACRNIGARQAKGDMLCFIDSDVCLDRDWLQHVCRAQHQGCRIGSGSIAVADSQKCSRLVWAQYYLQLNEYLPAGHQRCLRIVPGCNMFMRRDIFEKVGGFPDLRASEDTLLCLRLEGMEKIWFLPQAVCSHVFREEWHGFIQNQELLGRSISIYRKKHYKHLIYRGLLPVVLFPLFFLVKVTRMLLRIKKADHQHCFAKSGGLFWIGLFYWSRGFIKGCFQPHEALEH